MVTDTQQMPPCGSVGRAWHTQEPPLKLYVMWLPWLSEEAHGPSQAPGRADLDHRSLGSDIETGLMGVLMAGAGVPLGFFRCPGSCAMGPQSPRAVCPMGCLVLSLHVAVASEGGHSKARRTGSKDQSNTQCHEEMAGDTAEVNR